MTRLLSQTDIGSLVSMGDCIEVVETAFRNYASGGLQTPASVGVHADEGTFHMKAAHDSVFVAKVNANFPGNPSAHGLPTIQGVVVVMDLHRGSVLGILDSALITTMRTAAATAVAARSLARPDASVAAIVGCGALGRATVEALCVVRGLRTVRLWDLNSSTRDNCARDLSDAGDLEVVAATSLQAAVQGAEIVVTCTPSRQPFLDACHLRAGMFIAAVGADNPEKSEITPALMARALVVPDLLDQAAAMGDLRHAIAAGLLTRDDTHGELGDVLIGKVRGRQTDDEIFLFDSTGTALQDVAVASIAIEHARSAGAGLEFAFA